MTLGLLLGVSALFFIWDRRGTLRAKLPSVLVLVSLYWLSQAAANLYPGVAWTDRNLLGPGQSLFTFPSPQPLVDAVIFILIALSAFLVLRGSGTAVANEPRSLATK